jgi:hypothetical protein
VTTLSHQAIFFRNRKMRDKYDAVLKRWENAIRDASCGECPEGDVALLQATVNLLQEKATGISHGGAPVQVRIQLTTIA